MSSDNAAITATDNAPAERQNLADHFLMMNEMFFNKVASAALGHRVNVTNDDFFNNTTNTSSTLSNINLLFYNHDITKTLFNVISIDNSTPVWVKSGTSTTYTSVSLSNATQDWKSNVRNKINDPDSNAKVNDINVYNLCTDATCQTMLNALYAWHDLTSETNWATYMSGSNVTLKKAEITATGSNATETIRKGDSNTFKGDMNNIMNFGLLEGTKDIDMFMVRRVLYIYIRLFQFHIAMRVAMTYTTNKIAWALPTSIISLLERDISSLDRVIQKVDDITLQRKQEYKGTNDSINTLYDTIQEQKEYIKNQVERVGTESKYESRGKSMTIAALVILIAVIIGAILVLVLPLEKRKRLIGAGAVLGVASIGALIMSVVFSKVVVEGFASAFVDPYGADQIANTINAENGTILFSGEMRRKVLEYLQKSAMLVTSVKSYQILGNINYTMAKESRYFNDMDTQMKLAGERIKGNHRSSDLMQKQNSASMYFFVSVSIIVGAALVSLVAFDESPMARLITYIVAGFFLVLAMIIYVLEHSSYVRTDGDKKYWSQPPNGGMMMTT